VNKKNSPSIAHILGALLILAGLAYVGYTWLRIVLIALQVVGWFIWHWAWLVCLIVVVFVLFYKYFWGRLTRRID
jgi:hypothetical protein